MVWPRLLVVVVTVMTVMTTGRGEDTLPARQRLRDTLLHKYDKETIPSHMEPLIVTMNTLTIRNVEMHEETHSLQLHAWAGFTWLDKRLSWDPANYSGINRLSFNPQSLWQPDLTFYNAAASRDIPLIASTRLTVQNNGEVLVVATFDLRFSCVANLAYWPHDTHECRLKIGSWVYDGYTIELRVEDKLITELEKEVTQSPDGTLDTMEWQIVSDGVLREEIIYDCCPEPYINLQVMLQLYRQAPAYNWLIKAPAACLILLTLVVFVLPPGAGEKITFGGICLLLNLIFLLFAHGTVRYAPNHTPLLVKLVVVQLMVTAGSILVACWVVRAARAPYFCTPPSGIHSTNLRLAPVLCLSAYVRQGQGRRMTTTAGNEEVEMGSAAESSEREDPTRIAAQWILFGAVLDRVALGLYLIVSGVMLAKFFFVI